MPIVSSRVDERLVHGQVAMVWVRVVGADRIIVANDEAVHSQMQIEALLLAKPAGVKLAIVSIQRAIKNILAGKYDADRSFLITKNITDMKRLIAGGIGIKEFNVGNIAPRAGAQKIKNSVYLTPEDIDNLNEMIKAGIKITAQMVPSESEALITTFIKK